MRDDIQLPVPAFRLVHIDGSEYNIVDETVPYEQTDNADCYTADQLLAAVLADREQRAQPAPGAEALDAERYRWLRDPCSGAERVIFYSRGDYGKGLMSSEMLDDAIDAALAQRGEV